MAFKKYSAARYFICQQGWAYALLVAAGVGLGSYEIFSYQAVSRFALEGVESRGLVTHKSDYSSGGARKTYRMSYTFPTPADPYTPGIQNVSEGFYRSQADGSEIVVRYLPSDPTISAVEPGNIAKGFWWGLVASICLLVGGIAGGVFALLRARACVNLRERGEIRNATVTSHKIEGKKSEKGHMLWRDTSGAEGRTLTAPLANLLPVGASITIFADPQRRQKSVWEGDIGSR